MRLIDADQLRRCYEGHNGLDDKASYESIRKMIDLQPTIYDFNKILEKFDANANVQTGLKKFLKEGMQNDEIN